MVKAVYSFTGNISFGDKTWVHLYIIMSSGEVVIIIIIIFFFFFIHISHGCSCSTILLVVSTGIRMMSL